ncbi:MAG: GNAT family N-acetyltransferase [Candidatus Nanopelagicales bacterium]
MTPKRDRLDERSRILAAAAALFENEGIARVSRRTVANAADVPTRAVTSVGRSRTDLLRTVVADLPFPPTSQRIQKQAADSQDNPMETILTVARDAFGAPASVWDIRELQAVVLAPFDDSLADVVRQRIRLRWEAAASVIQQLRGSGAVDSAIDDDAATLHLLAVGAGLALLEPLIPQSTEAAAWLGLVARLLESLAAVDPPGSSYSGPRLPWRIRVVTAASPGATARVLRVMALLRADVRSMLSHAHPGDRQLLDLVVDVPADITRDAIEAALSTVSRQTIVIRGTAQDAEDLFTRVIDGATDLVADPAAAPAAAAALVLADSWQVTSATSGPNSSAEVMRLQWTPDLHVVLTRAGAPFVEVERGRASALLRLVDALSRAPEGTGSFGWRVTLKGGIPVAIRLARPADAEAVAAMHSRCTEQDRYQRYFAPVSQWREDQLRKLAGGHRGATLVAETSDGAIIGLGNVFPEQPDSTKAAEIAVIVEHEWQGWGLGQRLLELLIDLATRMEFDQAVALVLADNAAMITMLEHTRLTWIRDTNPDLPGTVVRLIAALQPTADA